MPLRPATEEEIEFLTQGEARPASDSLVPILEESDISDESWLDNPVMVARFVIDGATFGFSDEIAASVTAAVSKLAGSEQTYDEIYESTVSSLEASRNEYRERNSAAAFGLEVAGGLATLPVSAGGAVARGGLAIANRAGRAITGYAPRIADTVASFFPRISQAAGSTAVGRAAVSGVSAAAPLAATGALAGAGYAQQGEDVYDAAVEGALFNIMGGAVMSGLGNVIKGATSRKISAELGEGDDFIPIVAASDGTLANIYKNVIGNIPLAKGTLNRQLDKIQRPLREKVETLEQRLFQREGIKEAAAVEKYLSDSEKVVRNTYEELKAKVSKGTLTDEVKERINREQKRMEVVQSARINKVDEIISNSESNFRSSIVRSSMPATLLKKEVKDVLEQSPSLQDAYRKLGDYWNNKGFEVINKRTFLVNADKLTLDILEDAGDELDSLSKLYGGQKLNIQELIPDYLSGKIVRGRIKGEDLSDLRSSFSRAAYKFSQDVNNGLNAQRGFVLGKIVSKINDVIEGQLTGANLQKFKSDRTAYKTYVALGDAIRRASLKPGIRGSFDASDWLASLSSNQRKDFGRGLGTYQKQADQIGDLAKRRDNILLRGKDIIDRRIQLATQIAKDDLNKQFVTARANLAADAKAGISQKRENIALAQELTDKRNALNALDETINSKLEIPALGKRAGDIASLTALTAFGGLTSPASAAALVAAGRFAASPLGQRIIAGQTSAQRAIFEAAESAAPKVESARELISRGLISEDKATLTASEQDLIARRGTESAKAAAFERLTRSGKIEELKRRNFEGYKKLREAYRSLSSQ